MGITSEILLQIPKEKKYITGETIKGIVKFHLEEETEFKKISLSHVWKGYCTWKVHEHVYKANYVKPGGLRRQVGSYYIYEGSEKNVPTKIYFLNKDMDEKNTTLSAGTYEYPFEIDIPEDIPPSIKTDIGEIKHYLILKFKKPAFFSWNKNFKTKLTVYPCIDSSITDEPIIFTRDKTLFNLFSSKKREIKLEATLEKGYLTPNSERNISFVVTNNTPQIFTIKTELISKTKYTDNFMVEGYMFDKPKTVNKVIDSCTVETPSVPDNSISNMFNTIVIPPELHTVRHSKIISREYKLRVTLKLPLPHINSSVEVPVFVGEKPSKVSGEEAEPKEPIDDPPSYFEAMTEDKSKDSFESD